MRPKNRAEGVRSGNGIGQVRLNNVRNRSIEGTGKQGEWIKVSPEGIDVKNRFSILGNMDEEGIVSHTV